MKKSDLRVGMVVKLRKGVFVMVSITADEELVLDWGDGSSSLYLRTINEDLYHAPSYNNYQRDNKNYDIMEIYGYSCIPFKTFEASARGRKLLWERKEEVLEVTMEEICKKFGCEVKVKK